MAKYKVPSQTAEELCRRANECFNRKVNWDDRAQLASKYCIPHKANITVKKEEGAGVDIDVFDSIGMEDSQIAAAGLQAFMASSSSPWFGLEFEDKNLADDSDNKEWLQDTQETILNTLNDSNFNLSIGEYFHDLVVMPGSTMHGEEDDKDVVRFTNIPFEEVGIGLNFKGDCDELHRRFQYTVKQMVDRWGTSKVGEKINELYNNKKYDQKMPILHSVGERHVRNVAKKDALNMPFYSCYVDEKHTRKIEERGFIDFPYFLGRWRVNPGQDWGYSPAMIALPDLFMINEMAKTVMMGGQVAVAPPWLFPDENYVLPLDFNQFAINYGVPNPGSTAARDWKPFPLVSGSNLPIGIDLLNRLDTKIHGYFYRDLFLPLLEKTATAFEVAKVIEKRMTILGAVIGGIQRSTLSPIVEFTYNKLTRLPRNKRRLKPFPQSMPNGAAIKIKYISPLAIAQRTAIIETQNAFLYEVAQMMQINPEVRHKIKWDRAIDKSAEIRSIDPQILASKSEYEEAVTADRQAQAEARAMAMMNAGGEITGKYAKAGKDMKEAQTA